MTFILAIDLTGRSQVHFYSKIARFPKLIFKTLC